MWKKLPVEKQATSTKTFSDGKKYGSLGNTSNATCLKASSTHRNTCHQYAKTLTLTLQETFCRVLAYWWQVFLHVVCCWSQDTWHWKYSLINHTFFYQKKFLFPVVLHCWEDYRLKLLNQLKSIQGTVFSGDRRFWFDGPVLYGAYTMFSCDLNKIGHFDLFHVSATICYFDF